MQQNESVAVVYESILLINFEKYGYQFQRRSGRDKQQE